MSGALTQTAPYSDVQVPLRVAMDFVYTTDSLCRFARDFANSSDALATSLLPIDSGAFRGRLQLTTAAHGTGCALYVVVKGEMTTATATADGTDVYGVARAVHQHVTEFLSGKGLSTVALARASVALNDDKRLQVSMATGGTTAEHTSVLTVQKGACTDLLDALEAGADVLLPTHVQTSALEVTRVDAAGDAEECLVSVDVDALAPQLGADADAFQLLKAVDETIDSFFARQSTPVTLTSATVQLHLKLDDASGVLDVAQKTESVDAHGPTSVTLNAPSYNEALGIFALLAALAVVMIGVVALRKRNDRCSRERYERANRSAQIRRVSIRMSRCDQDAGHECEGEEDGLL
ncbi:unnamed protein product [Hyaloperonospora brassicae]|uniref:Uncharacterized protein n=1 Tax=Hyaloperonospora brassicae TaxID=162125 RepID=A0AAV0UWV6_HYABA|nr:unnamed protein product [Hyaloperonospora brassicae]